MATSVITIEEQTGKQRKLELKGAGLPLQGAQWGSSTLLVTEWNPGNVDATQHVISTQEDPSDWEGEWNTTRLLRSPCVFTDESGSRDVVLAHDLLDIMRLLQRGSQLLRVTWNSEVEERPTDQQGGTVPVRKFKITRKGRLSNVNFSVVRQDDIKWSASFNWTSRGDQQTKTVDTGGQDLLASLRAAIVASTAAAAIVANDRIRSEIARQKNAVTKFSLGQLEQLADAPLQLVDSFARAAINVSSRLKRLGDLVIQLRDTPASIAARLVDVAVNGLAVANNFTDRIGRIGPEQIATRNKVSVLTRSASYYSRSQTGSENMARTMQELLRAARERQQRFREQAGAQGAAIRTNAATSLQFHIPREGETMQSIATKFYGEDLSAELSRANGLPTYTVDPPRTALLIPSRGQLRTDQVDNV